MTPAKMTLKTCNITLAKQEDKKVKIQQSVAQKKIFAQNVGGTITKAMRRVSFMTPKKGTEEDRKMERLSIFMWLVTNNVEINLFQK